MGETPKAGSKLEQIREKVHSGLDLLSDEDLAAFFEEAEREALGQIPTEEATQTQTQPSVAPVKVESTPPVEEPSKGQAGLMDLLPDKFKDKDEAAALSKMVKALQELESENTRKSQELSQLSNVVQELSKAPVRREEYAPTARQVPKQAEPEEDDVDDSIFFDKPTESTKRVFQKEFKKAIVDALHEYDTFALRRDTLARFKESHPDFDSLRNEIVEVCRIHPEWDNDLNGLPKIYDAAKALASARNIALNVNKPASAITPAVDVEKLKAELKAELESSSFEKAKQAIIEEIKRRKAAAGIISSSRTSTPQERVNPQPTTTPLTEEEKIFKAMMDSGPQTLRDLGQYGDILTLPKA